MAFGLFVFTKTSRHTSTSWLKLVMCFPFLGYASVIIIIIIIVVIIFVVVVIVVVVIIIINITDIMVINITLNFRLDPHVRMQNGTCNIHSSK